jgi:hypothetical protein
MTKKIKKPYKTEREFRIAITEYERGMINAWQHIITIAKSCIKAHEEEFKPNRIKAIVKFNKHLYESDESL